MYSRQQLADDFRKLGVTEGDIVMLHASIRAVGEVAGGPDQIHLALKDALTPAGTLMMYAGCPRYYDEVGRGQLTPEQESDILEKLPAFDASTARSARDNGALVECLRTWPGVRVNAHVTRFAVWGKQADYLISKQPWNYAMGLDSALDRFVKVNGKILLLGSDPDAVTFLHYAEHVVDIPHKIVARYRVPVEEDGRRIWRAQEEFDTSERAHPNWPEGFFATIVQSYLVSKANVGTLVGDAPSYLFPAAELLDHALPLMRAVAADPRAADALDTFARQPFSSKD